MSDAIKEMVSVSADSFWYHERLAVGRMVYLTGWVVWFVSIWMPAAYVSGGAAYPVGTWLYLVVAIVDVVRHAVEFKLTFSAAPLAAYFLGLVASATSFLFRYRLPLQRIAKVFALGVLLGCYPGWSYLSGYHGQDPFCLGLPALGLGGLMICVGVWLIPPRLKGGKSARENGKKSATSDPKPDSATEGT